jgi:transposase-like protein
LASDLNVNNAGFSQQALQAFADGPMGTRYPPIVVAWEQAWEHVVLFFIFPPAKS